MTTRNADTVQGQGVVISTEFFNFPNQVKPGFYMNYAHIRSLKNLLLVAPDSQLDAQMKPLIEKWGEDPKAIQILEVLDQCVHASLASGFTIKLFQTMLDIAIAKEETTYEEVVKQATWRNLPSTSLEFKL